MPKTSEATVKVRVDFDEFFDALHQAIDTLPDEILDRLAAKIEQRLVQQARLRGER